MPKENRAFFNSKLETRSEGEDGKLIVDGYALQWDKLSEPIGHYYSFREMFKRGSFQEYLSDSSKDTKALIEHNMINVVGRSMYNTLTLTEDEIGLKIRAELPNNTKGNDLYESIRRGDIDGISVGFDPDLIEWDERDEDNPIRIIKRADLPEISFTSWALYKSSSVNARNAMSKNEEQKESPYYQKVQKRNKIIENKKYLNKLYINSLK